jgi:ligand-binding SRPBCC domain-containing protein
MEFQLLREHQLPCEPETAWKFFSSPHNLARITPKEMRFKVLSNLPDDNIYEGMVIDYKVSPLLGIQMLWQSKITQVNQGSSFTDFQMKGPYRHWNHFHEFIPNGKGVLMRDTVDYALPMGFLGRMSHTLFVREKLNYIFNYRFKVLEKIFNTQKFKP